jgi:hypothetical protein
MQQFNQFSNFEALKRIHRHHHEQTMATHIVQAGGNENCQNQQLEEQQLSINEEKKCRRPSHCRRERMAMVL